MNGITFEDKHSYLDWGLFLKSRPVISPPIPKTMYVDIPGSDGVIDLTESLTGDVKFENRTIRCEFWVLGARDRWSDIYSEIMDYLHGQQMKIILDEDASYYYMGRLKVNEWKSDKATSTISIEGTVEPYKLKNDRTAVSLSVNGQATVLCRNLRKSVVPTIITDAEFRVEFEDTSYAIPAGESIVPDILFKAGDNILYCYGTGNITFTYQEGSL